jgi:hypothetical protein
MAAQEPKQGKNRGNAGKGRKKGVPNKATASLKDAILNAFTTVGGEDYLVHVAQNDPRTFCALIGRVLPNEVQAQVSGSLTILTGVARP